ncbi:alpha/beta fold hydrolase [Bacillaceae bacterium W0354]
MSNQINDSYVNNRGVNIHYLIKEGEEGNLAPLVIIPGLAESSEDYINFIQQFQDRTCVVITLRGRGKSDAPLSEYSLDDHISDIETVMNKLGLDSFHLFGYSRGVSYMLGFALKYLNKIKSIVIGDYPAIHTKLPEQWVDYFIDMPPWRGKSTLERMPKHALEGIQRDSSERNMWDELSTVKCPVLIINGGKKGAILLPEHNEIYNQSLLNVQFVTMEDSDHNIFEPSEQRLVKVIKNFLD